MIYLQQLRQLFLRLNMRQRIMTGVAAILVLCGLLGLRHWQTERNFKSLFQDLSGEDAGMVLAKLKEAAVEVRLENGGKTIKVPADRVDELRIQMASAGLPKSGRIGFELFDKPNFGTSEFAEQVNYHRAVEGELERSVMAIQEVESARVHITFPRQSLFLENRQPAKASVLLKLKPDAMLSKQNVQAIAHLASSAVDGLGPENVSILDMRGNLLSKPGKSGDSDGESSKELIEYRERMEKALLEKVRSTLEPLVGADGFRAAVSLECDLASGDQSEESFDPARSVIVTSQRTEDGTSPAQASSGVPGTPSNLPRPTSRPGVGTATPLFRRSENVTYQTSRVIRHTKFPHGMIKRLSTSVLLDHTVKMVGGKRMVEPPAPEQLRAIKEIVSATVGFQQDRGDLVIVESLPFETTRNLPPMPGTVTAATARPRLYLPSGIPDWVRVPMEGHLNWLLDQSWLPVAVIILIGAILYGLFRLAKAFGRKAGGLVKLAAAKVPLGKKKGQHVDVTLEPSLEGTTAHQLESGQSTLDEVTKTLDEQLRERELIREKMTHNALLELEIPKAEVRRGDVLARHLSDLANKDPQAVANLIRGWTEEKGSA